MQHDDFYAPIFCSQEQYGAALSSVVLSFLKNKKQQEFTY